MTQPDPVFERGAGLRWLSVISVVETVSLVVLLANRASVHLPLVTTSVGPLHGFAYLATIAVAFLLPLGTRTRLLAFIPGVGGLLALRRARATTPVTSVRSGTDATATGRAREQPDDDDDPDE